MQSANLGKTLERHVTEFRDVQESRQQSIYDGGFENVSQWNPVQKPKESFEGGLDQAGLVCRPQNIGTQLEDRRKLLGHRGLEVSSLNGGHLILGEIKNLFRQKSKDGHVVFANGETGMARGNDLVDKIWPVMRPLLLQNGDQDQVELVQKSAFVLQSFLGFGVFNDEVDDKVSNS